MKDSIGIDQFIKRASISIHRSQSTAPRYFSTASILPQIYRRRTSAKRQASKESFHVRNGGLLPTELTRNRSLRNKGSRSGACSFDDYFAMPLWLEPYTGKTNSKKARRRVFDFGPSSKRRAREFQYTPAIVGSLSQMEHFDSLRNKHLDRSTQRRHRWSVQNSTD